MSVVNRMLHQTKRLAKRMLLHVTRAFPWFSPEVAVPHVVLGEAGADWCVATKGINVDSVVYSIGVGSNISFDEELISRFGCMVYGFDPTPASVRAMASRSLPEKFRFIPLGVSGYDGSATFAPPPNPKHVSYRITSGGGQSGLPSLEVRRIATLMEQFGHSRIDLLKMDVEGAEYDVIGDILETKLDIRQMCVEFHVIRGGGTWTTMSKTITSLRRRGWQIFYVSSSGFEISFISGGMPTT